MMLAFVHKSYAADYKDVFTHNERLEFLGDGILGAIINKLLFVNHPEMTESDLTLYKIALAPPSSELRAFVQCSSVPSVVLRRDILYRSCLRLSYNCQLSETAGRKTSLFVRSFV